MWIASDPTVRITYNPPLLQTYATVVVSGKDINITPARTEILYFANTLPFQVSWGTVYINDDLFYDRLDTNGNKVWKWDDDTSYDAVYFSAGYWYIKRNIFDYFG